MLWIPINALRPELGTPGVNELSATSMVVLVLAINFRLVMEMSSWRYAQEYAEEYAEAMRLTSHVA